MKKGTAITDQDAIKLAIYMSNNPMSINDIIRYMGRIPDNNSHCYADRVLTAMEVRGFMVALDDETDKYFIVENQRLKEVIGC